MWVTFPKVRPGHRAPYTVQQRQMPHSHHSHSGQFCKHASGALQDVVLAAIERGFKTFALTEHCPRFRDKDLYPEEIQVSGRMTNIIFLIPVTRAIRELS